MKHISVLFSTVVSASLLFGCSSNNSSAGKEGAIAGSPAATAGSADASDDAVFSCKIDGNDFSGKGKDQFGDAAFVTAPGLVNFVLMPLDALKQGIPAQFAFTVADKGTTTIHGSDDPKYSAKYSPANTVDNSYQCKVMSVIITSSGSKRLTGTFSGTLSEPKTDRDVPVTDGRFDIPYSSYSK